MTKAEQDQARELLFAAFAAGWQAGLAMKIRNPRVLAVVESCFDLWLKDAVDESDVLGLRFRTRQDLPGPFGRFDHATRPMPKAVQDRQAARAAEPAKAPAPAPAWAGLSIPTQRTPVEGPLTVQPAPAEGPPPAGVGRHLRRALRRSDRKEPTGQRPVA